MKGINLKQRIMIQLDCILQTGAANSQSGSGLSKLPGAACLRLLLSVDSQKQPFDWDEARRLVTELDELQPSTSLMDDNSVPTKIIYVLKTTPQAGTAILDHARAEVQKHFDFVHVFCRANVYHHAIMLCNPQQSGRIAKFWRCTTQDILRTTT